MASPLEQPPPPSGPVGSPGSSAPPPSLSGLAGQGSPQPGDQSIQLVTQHLMEAEQALTAAAQIKPELAGIVTAFINTVKPQAGQILFGGGTGASMQPPLPPSPGPAGGMMGGMMAGGAPPPPAQ
jgi:hypothetical protein